MVFYFLRILHPGRWITSFACWWLRIDAKTLATLPNEVARLENGTHTANNHGNSLFDSTLKLDIYEPSRAIWASSIKDKIFSWNFDIFDLATKTQGNPLYTVTIAMMDSFDLLDGWKVDRRKMSNFLIQIESAYVANSYHNNTHAADVTQTAAVIMHSFRKHVSELSKLEAFCIILACAIHDLGHLGVNNDFLVNTKHRRATTYNDKSVNEMYHVCAAYEIARENVDCDIFEGFTKDEQKKIRKYLIEMVLATDMAIHFDLLKSFNKQIESHPNMDDWADRSLLFQMIVHLADIANPSRPFPLARGWAERVIQEFLDQGDREASIGMPVTPFCNRANMCMPRAQLGFINIFLKPTLISFEKAAPEFTSMALEHLALTIKEWSVLEASGFCL